MPILRRQITAVDFRGIAGLGAVSEGDGATLWLAADLGVGEVRERLGASLLALGGTRRTLRARLDGRAGFEAPGRETALFAGLNVLVAIRNGERSEAVADWLGYHAQGHGAEAALIFDRTEGDGGVWMLVLI